MELPDIAGIMKIIKYYFRNYLFVKKNYYKKFKILPSISNQVQQNVFLVLGFVHIEVHSLSRFPLLHLRNFLSKKY